MQLAKTAGFWAVAASLVFCSACDSPAKHDGSERLKDDYRSAISAYNSGNAPRYKSYLCEAFVNVASKITPLDDSEKLLETLEITGKRVINGIDSVKIDGDQATAVIEFYDEKVNKDKPTTQTLNFLREGDGWKLCVAPVVSSPITSIPPFPQ
ncbi:Rv0361 family membrane protein [Mycobacteroides franklinii]|uniref:Rv0361 family membrane protein n=1 Tax=Mycobacteroides franklinii TaxID=948102 RepID=UPI001041FCCB|nr:hypothetical protein [Mycobacteroides franklinii]